MPESTDLTVPVPVAAQDTVPSGAIDAIAPALVQLLFRRRWSFGVQRTPPLTRTALTALPSEHPRDTCCPAAEWALAAAATDGTATTTTTATKVAASRIDRDMPRRYTESRCGRQS